MQMLLLIGYRAQWFSGGCSVSRLSCVVPMCQVSCWCAPCLVIYTCAKWLLKAAELLTFKMRLNTQNSGPWKGRELEDMASGGLLWASGSPGWSWRGRKRGGDPRTEVRVVAQWRRHLSICLLFTDKKYHFLMACCEVNWCCFVEQLNSVWLFFFPSLPPLLKIKLIKQLQTWAWTLGRWRPTTQKLGWKEFQGNTSRGLSSFK